MTFPQGRAPTRGADTLAFQTVGADVPPSAGAAAEKRRHVWPWVVLAVALIALVGAGTGGWWYFRSHTLPGVTMWGNPVTGRTQAQIADAIDSQVDSATVTVNHDGKSVDVKLSDLGLDVDSDDIARQAFEAKRTDSVLSRYLPWNHVDVVPELVNAAAADGAGLDAALGTGDQEPVDAQVNLNADGTGFDVAAAQTGNGADTQPVAEALVKSIESLGTAKGGSQEAVIKSIQPAVTDDIANQAKVTLDKYLATPIAIKVNDRDIATIDAEALGLVHERRSQRELEADGCPVARRLRGLRRGQAAAILRIIHQTQPEDRPRGPPDRRQQQRGRAADDQRRP